MDVALSTATALEFVEVSTLALDAQGEEANLRQASPASSSDSSGIVCANYAQPSESDHASELFDGFPAQPQNKGRHTAGTEADSVSLATPTTGGASPVAAGASPAGESETVPSFLFDAADSQDPPTVAYRQPAEVPSFTANHDARVTSSVMLARVLTQHAQSRPGLQSIPTPEYQAENQSHVAQSEGTAATSKLLQSEATPTDSGDASTIDIPSVDFSMLPIPPCITSASLGSLQPLKEHPVREENQDGWNPDGNASSSTVQQPTSTQHPTAEISSLSPVAVLRAVDDVPAHPGAQSGDILAMFPQTATDAATPNSSGAGLAAPIDAQQPHQANTVFAASPPNEAGFPTIPMPIPHELSPARQRSISEVLSSHMCSRIDNPSFIGSSGKIPSYITTSSNPWPECLFPATKPPVSSCTTHNNPPKNIAANLAATGTRPMPKHLQAYNTSDTSCSKSHESQSRSQGLSTRLPPMVKFQFLPGGSASAEASAAVKPAHDSTACTPTAGRAPGASQVPNTASFLPLKSRQSSDRGRWPGTAGAMRDPAPRSYSLQYSTLNTGPNSSSSAASTVISRSIAADIVCAGATLQRLTAAGSTTHSKTSATIKRHYRVPAPRSTRHERVLESTTELSHSLSTPHSQIKGTNTNANDGSGGHRGQSKDHQNPESFGMRLNAAYLEASGGLSGEHLLLNSRCNSQQLKSSFGCTAVADHTDYAEVHPDEEGGDLPLADDALAPLQPSSSGPVPAYKPSALSVAGQPQPKLTQKMSGPSSTVHSTGPNIETLPAVQVQPTSLRQCWQGLGVASVAAVGAARTTKQPSSKRPSSCSSSGAPHTASADTACLCPEDSEEETTQACSQVSVELGVKHSRSQSSVQDSDAAGQCTVTRSESGRGGEKKTRMRRHPDSQQQASEGTGEPSREKCDVEQKRDGDNSDSSRRDTISFSESPSTSSRSLQTPGHHPGCLPCRIKPYGFMPLRRARRNTHMHVGGSTRGIRAGGTTRHRLKLPHQQVNSNTTRIRSRMNASGCGVLRQAGRGTTHRTQKSNKVGSIPRWLERRLGWGDDTRSTSRHRVQKALKRSFRKVLCMHVEDEDPRWVCGAAARLPSEAVFTRSVSLSSRGGQERS